MDFRKRFFTETVVGHWNKLSREVVMAASLPEFKKYLDNTLRLCFDIWVVLCGDSTWTLDFVILVGPFQLGLLFNSMIL